ncbi:MAG: hypothetical protein WBJ03_13125 [Moraxellaceae bacterium]
MKIVLVHSGKAFLPEIYAYQTYLEGKGHQVSLQAAGESATQTGRPDLYYRFAGFLRHRLSPDVPEIHEYASASVGAFPRVKNLLKSVVSTRPVGRVFLNTFVNDQFHFPAKAPFLFRDMGADKAFFDQRGHADKIYDLVYAGSITGRAGVLECITRLAGKGLRIGLAGTVTEQELVIIRSQPCIDYVGRLPVANVPAFIARARFGLNFCPDIYPYNQQTSTKVIEYLAAGIGIVSNRYAWIVSHASQNGYGFLDVSDIDSVDSLVGVSNAILDSERARQFEWARLLERADLDAFIRRCSHSNNTGSVA